MQLNTEQTLLLKNCEDGDRGLANYGHQILNETSKIEILPNGDVCSYSWNDGRKLWVLKEKGAKLLFFNETTSHLKPLCEAFAELASKPDDPLFSTQRQQFPKFLYQAKMLGKFLDKCNEGKTMSVVWNMICCSLATSQDRQMDHYSDFLPLKGGKKISLRTGQITDRTRDDLWSYEILATGTDCTDQAKADVQRYYQNICYNDEGHVDAELMKYFQTLMGYFMTFEVGDKSVYFFVGHSDSGKSDIVNQMVHVLTKKRVGPVQSEVFVASNNSSNHQTYLLAMKGKSLVFCQELPKGRQLNSDTVKRSTGDDEVNIRRCNGKDNENIRITSKLAVFSNVMVEIDGSDSGMKTRLKKIPMNRDLVHLPPAERQLNLEMLVRLKSQDGANALFAWWLEGAMQYYANSEMLIERIELPAVVVEQNQTFLQESDSFKHFLEDRTDVWTAASSQPKSEYVYKRDDIQRDYRAFCTKHSYTKEQVAVKSQVVDRLKQLLHDRRIRGDWIGIRVRVEEVVQQVELDLPEA